ncbi:hypothetical protein [Pedobacter sp. SYP-B3415]|uniref:hypothetical protein n=1 Tax=Pedobacter sp. SYP-B3415 TaxID=2496641 RepID=UPI001F102825|nr:hypothetical protein [Pedobacter sp. SYP-B3415]
MIIFIVVIIAAYLLQMALPWWIIIVVSFITCGLIGKTAKVSLWGSFFAIFCLWSGYAVFESLPNQHMLANRVAEMFGVKVWWALVLLTGFLGGFVAGVSGFCGHHFRKAMLAKNQAAE